MRHRRAVAIAIVTLGLTIAALATLGRDWLQAEPGPPNIPFRLEPVPGDEEEEFVVPTLTAEQIATAEEILAGDSRASALLRGSSYTYEAIPGIDSDSGSNELVGIGMLITFDPPISIEGIWLLNPVRAPGDPPGLEPQEILEYMPDCAAPNGVVRAIALVDSTQGKLMQLQPLPVPGFDISISHCPGGAR